MTKKPRKRGPKPIRADINVTLGDLWDIVACLHVCYSKGYAYGHGGDEDNLLAVNRKRLETRLEALAKSLTSKEPDVVTVVGETRLVNGSAPGLWMQRELPGIVEKFEWKPKCSCGAFAVTIEALKHNEGCPNKAVREEAA